MLKYFFLRLVKHFWSKTWWDQRGRGKCISYVWCNSYPKKRLPPDCERQLVYKGNKIFLPIRIRIIPRNAPRDSSRTQGSHTTHMAYWIIITARSTWFGEEDLKRRKKDDHYYLLVIANK